MSAEKYNSLTSCAQQCQVYLEPQMEWCPLIFGETNSFGTCNATGAPCHNTFETCKSPCDYVCRNRSEAWTKCQTTDFPVSKPIICDFPKITGGRVELCGGLPTAGGVNIEIQDFDDKGEPGTYVEKYVQQNNWENRYAQLSYGFCGSEFTEDYIQRDLYIDDIDGPNGDECKYQIKLKDAFSLLNDDSAKFPRKTTNRLRSPITKDALRFIVESGDGFDAQTDAVCIDGEAMRVQWIKSDVKNGDPVEMYAITQRAVCGSVQKTDTIESFTEVQIAKRYPKDTHIAELLFDLFHRDGDGLPFTDQDCDCGPFTKAVINAAQMRELANNPCYSRFIIDETYICEPTGIRSLYKELIPFMFIPHFNCDGMIELSVYEPPKCGEELPTFDQEWIADCDIEVKSLRSERYSVTTLLSNPEDCTKGIADGNIERIATSINTFGLGDACNNPNFTGFKEKEFESRFFRGCNYSLAATFVSRFDYVLRQKRRRVTFQYPAFKMPPDLTQTGLIVVNHKKLQNSDGEGSEDIFYVNSIDLIEPNCYRIVATSSGFKTTEKWADSWDCDDPCGVQWVDGTDCSSICETKIW